MTEEMKYICLTPSNLRAARGLIEAGFTQRAMARDAKGEMVLTSNPAAVSFCAVGALARVCERTDLVDFSVFHTEYTALTGEDSIGALITLNDTGTREDVLEKFNQLIEKALANE
jgi:hypothetical protein